MPDTQMTTVDKVVHVHLDDLVTGSPPPSPRTDCGWQVREGGPAKLSFTGHPAGAVSISDRKSVGTAPGPE